MVSFAVERWLGLWEGTEHGRATLINLSENHTFRIDGPHGSRHVLRLHRPGYQSLAAIQSELAWVAALRDTGLPLPEAVAGRNGELVQQVGGERFAVLFAFEEGGEPLPGEHLAPLFKTIGGLAAAAHRHVERWHRPPGFVRPAWTAETILDPDGLWGDWRRAPHVEGATRTTLERLDQRLRADLAAYGTAPGRFGLIHADMRLANLLVDGERVTLIDFDDCGFGWFIYDLAASLSFIETDPHVPALKRRWIEGYTAIRPLSDEDLRIIDAMILLRRMALLAWIGSHAETSLAAQFRAQFANDTARMAEAWLS
ncbi:MAG: phosphotransferase enzyme family protein [Devosia sp.]